MALVTLTVEPDLCGPVSVGTVCLVKLLAQQLGLSLAESVAAVERCVFDAAPLRLNCASEDGARRLMRLLSELPIAERITVRLEPATGAAIEMRANAWGSNHRHPRNG